MKKSNLPKPTKGRAWVGTWTDNTLGWGVPNFVHTGDPGRLRQKSNPWFWDDKQPVYLCEITIKIVRDKLGRPITRKNTREDRP